MRRDQAPIASEPKSNLARKSMSVENINKIKPVLMKNINLESKSHDYVSSIIELTFLATSTSRPQRSPLV